jgi:hypothetical protein
VCLAISSAYILLADLASYNHYQQLPATMALSKGRGATSFANWGTQNVWLQTHLRRLRIYLPIAPDCLGWKSSFLKNFKFLLLTSVLYPSSFNCVFFSKFRGRGTDKHIWLDSYTGTQDGYRSFSTEYS